MSVGLWVAIVMVSTSEFATLYVVIALTASVQAKYVYMH